MNAYSRVARSDSRRIQFCNLSGVAKLDAKSKLDFANN